MAPRKTKSEAWLAGLPERRVALGIAIAASTLLVVVLVMPGAHTPREQAAVQSTPATPHPASSESSRSPTGPKYAIPAKPVAATPEKSAAPAVIQPITPSTPSQPAKAHAPVARTQAKPAPKPEPARIPPKPPAPKPATARPSAQPASKTPATTGKAAGTHVFFVQVAAYRNHASAQQHAASLLQKGWSSVVIRNARGWFTVRVGPVSSRAEADRLRRRLRSKTGVKGFIVEGQ